MSESSGRSRATTRDFSTIDHVVLAVPELKPAMARLSEALGLTIELGGEHPGAGTHNAIAPFPDGGYLELLAAHDATLARQSAGGRRLLARLNQGAGWLGYALGTENLDQTIAQLRSRGVVISNAEAVQRRRPDGTELRGRAAFLEDDAGDGLLPFVIEHQAPHNERFSGMPSHASEATAVRAVGIAVRDLDATVPLYSRVFGVDPLRDHFEYVPSRRATWRLPNRAYVRLMQDEPAGAGLIARVLEQQGEGLFVVALSTPDVERSVAELRRRGTAISDPQPGRAAFTLDPSQTLGAVFVFLERRAGRAGERPRTISV